MTVVTAAPNLIDNLITALKAASTLSDVTIYDGPQISEDYPNKWIAVGHDGTEDGEVVAYNSRNEYGPLGAKKMYEDGAINCVLVAWTGDTVVSDARTAGLDILSKVDTVIRNDPSFGGVVLYSGLESHAATYIQSNAGLGIEIIFTIFYKART